MNILFFLSPKQDLMYVYDDFTLRQTLEKWENNRYASIPVLNRRGEYVGTLTEGDILWGAFSVPTVCGHPDGGRHSVGTEKAPRAGSGSSGGRAHLVVPSQAGLQGRDRDHQHGSAGGGGHEPELCAGGG